MEVLQELISLFVEKGIDFEFMAHPPEGNTINASTLRGHSIEEAAKSMLVTVKKEKSSKSEIVGYFLVVVPGHRRIDFKAVARYANGRRTDFANTSELSRLMKCQSGAVPPFSFHPEVKVLVDELIIEQDRIVFNAGRLDRSIAISTAMYVRNFDFPLAQISKTLNESIYLN